MKVPLSLTQALDDQFEKDLAQELVTLGYLDDAEDLHNRRFISRSVLPHLARFMELFNRRGVAAGADAAGASASGGAGVSGGDSAGSGAIVNDGLDAYWSKGSNPENLRLAYILSFLPTNLFRSASIGGELARLGYRFPFQTNLRALELGAGPASASIGLALSQKCSPWGLPTRGNWALIEQDRTMLRVGSALLSAFSRRFLGSAATGDVSSIDAVDGEAAANVARDAASGSGAGRAGDVATATRTEAKPARKKYYKGSKKEGRADLARPGAGARNEFSDGSGLSTAGWEVREFARKLDWTQPLLPKAAPRFQLMLTSYVLNEAQVPISQLAERWLELFDSHLEQEGLVILIEPALRLQSRKLLELRREFLAAPQFKNLGMQVLLPCLGHQVCGALTDPDDWCHEEVSWWRPKFVKLIDDLGGMDRKTLPFSYLVLTKSARPRTDLLPALKGPNVTEAAAVTEIHTHRLVSPPFSQGQDLEFFLCSSRSDGKRRARLRVPREERDEIERGTILVNADVRGESNASRVDRFEHRV